MTPGNKYRSYLRLPLLLLFANALPFAVFAKDELRKCYEKQVKANRKYFLKAEFNEELNRFEHASRPWKESKYRHKGFIYIKGNRFLKDDTILVRKEKYHSKLELNDSQLFQIDYVSKDLSEVSYTEFIDERIKTARYSPNILLEYFSKKQSREGKCGNDSFTCYTEQIGKYQVRLYIDRSRHLISKISTLHYDPLYGDLITTYSYSEYDKKLNVPHKIEILKVNGRLRDEVLLNDLKIHEKSPDLISKPLAFKFKEETEKAEEIRVQKFSDRIRFIEFKHAHIRTMLVEFDSFYFVEGAPLNSRNGALMLEEIKKLNPSKPVRYFSFGHHHPHYLGGFRPFVHKGVTILSPAMDLEYIKYLSGTSHSLSPDSLHLYPSKVKTQEISDSLIIGDFRYALKIYMIGSRSKHTEDYLIYYFPEEKLIYEDDLVWVRFKGEPEKAGASQEGLYKAIIDLGLEVETIVQSWRLDDEDYKSVIPFTDLQKSIKP